MEEVRQMDSKAMVRSVYECFNRKDLEGLVAYMTEDHRQIVPGTHETFEGRKGMLQFVRMWADGFPDAQLTLESIIGEGDDVVVQFTAHGTHTGPFVTSEGTLPPSGKKMELNFCEVLQLKGDKIQRSTVYFDRLSLMKQLGTDIGIPGQKPTMKPTEVRPH